MKKHFRIVITAMLILVLAVSAFAPAAFAEGTVKLALGGRIEITDHPADFSEEYVIVLTAEDNANPMPEGSADGVCETAVAAGEFKLPEINFSELGVYKYTLSQKAGTAERWTYDDSVYHITVYVTNAENGEGTEINVVAYKNDETTKSEIIFTNTYDPAPVTVIITAQKTLQGSKLKAEQFSFELKDEAGTVLQTAKNAEDGSIRFEGITFDEVGTYTFQLSEVIGTEKGMTYDSSVYKLTYTVTQDGDLVASLAVEKNGTAQNIQEPEFVNEYVTPPGDNSNIVLWVALFAVSAVAVIVLAVIGKKRK